MVRILAPQRLEDQLDEIWKILRTLKLPKDAQVMVDEIDRIKAKYPKPE